MRTMLMCWAGPGEGRSRRGATTMRAWCTSRAVTRRCRRWPGWSSLATASTTSSTAWASAPPSTSPSPPACPSPWPSSARSCPTSSVSFSNKLFSTQGVPRSDQARAPNSRALGRHDSDRFERTCPTFLYALHPKGISRCCWAPVWRCVRRCSTTFCQPARVTWAWPSASSSASSRPRLTSSPWPAEWRVSFLFSLLSFGLSRFLVCSCRFLAGKKSIQGMTRGFDTLSYRFALSLDRYILFPTTLFHPDGPFRSLLLVDLLSADCDLFVVCCYWGADFFLQFLYISLVDMMPEMNETAEEASRVSVAKALKVLGLQNAGILTGVAALFILAKFQNDIVLG